MGNLVFKFRAISFTETLFEPEDTYRRLRRIEKSKEFIREGDREAVNSCPGSVYVRAGEDTVCPPQNLLDRFRRTSPKR